MSTPQARDKIENFEMSIIESWISPHAFCTNFKKFQEFFHDLYLQLSKIVEKTTGLKNECLLTSKPHDKGYKAMLKCKKI